MRSVADISPRNSTSLPTMTARMTSGILLGEFDAWSRSAGGSCPRRWTATALEDLHAVAPGDLGNLVEAILDRIGAHAIGVFRQQREILVDLPGLDLGALDQRILAVANGA